MNGGVIYLITKLLLNFVNIKAQTIININILSSHKLWLYISSFFTTINSSCHVKFYQGFLPYSINY